MKHLPLLATLVAALGLAACDRPTVVNTPPSSTVAVPVPVPVGVGVPGPAGEPGKPGAPGMTGSPGSPGAPGDTNVIVVQPPASAPR